MLVMLLRTSQSTSAPTSRLTPRLVATTRLGYYFENYGDRGFPTAAHCLSGSATVWLQTEPPTIWRSSCQPLPSKCLVSLMIRYSGTFTRRNSNKALQYDADLAWFKSGWGGTHNFKFGYQLNRLQNDILQSYNEPYVQLFVGAGSNGSYAPLSSNGVAACATATYQFSDGSCAGLYGTANVFDFGTGGNVTSFNHGLFAQDAWTIGHGLTVNAGLRFDREYLPASSEAWHSLRIPSTSVGVTRLLPESVLPGTYSKTAG